MSYNISEVKYNMLDFKQYSFELCISYVKETNMFVLVMPEIKLESVSWHLLSLTSFQQPMLAAGCDAQLCHYLSKQNTVISGL